MSGGVRWLGKEVKDRVMRATAAAINETMADAVSHAKNDHPGWTNRSGTAEGSVRVVQVASAAADDVVGRWGSMGVQYVSLLEFWHGSFLRNAADATYGTLKPRINRRLL